MRRFDAPDREEIRKMLKLANIRDTAVWKEAKEEGETLADLKWVRRLLANGMSVKQIAELMEIPLKEARRLAKDAAK